MQPEHAEQEVGQPNRRMGSVARLRMKLASELCQVKAHVDKQQMEIREQGKVICELKQQMLMMIREPAVKPPPMLSQSPWCQRVSPLWSPLSCRSPPRG